MIRQHTATFFSSSLIGHLCFNSFWSSLIRKLSFDLTLSLSLSQSNDHVLRSKCVLWGGDIHRQCSILFPSLFERSLPLINWRDAIFVPSFWMGNILTFIGQLVKIWHPIPPFHIKVSIHRHHHHQLDIISSSLCQWGTSGKIEMHWSGYPNGNLKKLVVFGWVNAECQCNEVFLYIYIWS